MHALVTGGGGFLGRYIVEQLLARGDRVRSFGRGAYPELAAMGAEVVRGDISDDRAVIAACKGIDCVFHAGGQAGIGGAFADYQRTNVQGTQNILAACRIHLIPRLVYTSSPSITFAGEDQSGIDESTPPNFDWMKRNAAHYSYTKAVAEAAVLAANDNPTTLTCALRPHLIWGSRDTHLIPRLIARARSGRLRRVGPGKNLVDITYVENAAAAHVQAADALASTDSAVAGNAYYLSQGAPVNCWQWINEVLALANLQPITKSISYPMARRIGAACELAYSLLGLKREPPMTRFLAAQLARSHWFDISAARRDFGYEPKVSTAEGMRRLAAWLKTSA